MLKKLSVIDQIDVMRDGSLHVRRADLIMENKIEIAKNYHRNVLHPGDDLNGQDDKIVAVAGAVWTTKVIKDYKDKLEREAIEREKQ